jgi:hypothetical protein
VATVPIVSETSVVTGSTSERVGDVSHVATVPIDTSSGRDIVETTITKTVTMTNSNSPSGIIDTGTSISIGPVASIVFFSIFMELLSGDVTVTEDFLFSFSVPIFTEAVFMFDLTPDVCKLLPVEIDVPVSIIPLGELELP